MKYQDDAFAKVIDGGGTKNVASELERPIVVVGGNSFEREVTDAVGLENGGEVSFGVAAVGFAAVCVWSGHREEWIVAV